MNTVTKTKTARMFFAVPVPDEVKEPLREAVAQYPKLVERQLPDEAWHMTLIYMGQVRNYQWYLRRLCEEMPQIYMPTVSINYVGRGLARRQLWAYVHQTKPLDELRKQLQYRLFKQIRMPMEVRLKELPLFVPHVRLASLYPLTRAYGMADWPVQVTFPFDKIQLYRSDPVQGGVKYSVVGEIGL